LQGKFWILDCAGLAVVLGANEEVADWKVDSQGK